MRPALPTLIALAFAPIAAQAMDGTFLWDPLPKKYRVTYQDYYGRGMETSADFERSDRWAAHFAMYQPDDRPGVGVFGGAGLAYEHNTDGGLRFDSFSIFALGGPFARPASWVRIGMPLRFGIGFDGLTLPNQLVGSLPGSPAQNGIQSYSLCGLEYSAAASIEFIIGRHFIIGAHGGIQGAYASSTTYYYYTASPSGYVSISTWGPVGALCVGARW